MEVAQAIALIKGAVPQAPGTWADIGAGTGLFSQALDELLPAGSTIIAFDKSPHPLYYLRLRNNTLKVEEGDFTRKISLPMLDGIVMANALHCVEEPLAVLQQLRCLLQPAGALILVEHERKEALLPWIPFPISRGQVDQMAAAAGFEPPINLNTLPGGYGRDPLYACRLQVSNANS